MTRIALLCTVLSLLTLGALAPALSAHADTVYFPSSSSWGKTYRNNFVSSGCHDQYGGTSSCYQGSWAESYSACPSCSDAMSVSEPPREWIPTLPGNWTGPFYWYHKPDVQNATVFDAYVGSDYDALFDHCIDVGTKTANGKNLTFVYTYDQTARCT